MVLPGGCDGYRCNTPSRLRGNGQVFLCKDPQIHINTLVIQRMCKLRLIVNFSQGDLLQCEASVARPDVFRHEAYDRTHARTQIEGWIFIFTRSGSLKNSNIHRLYSV